MFNFFRKIGKSQVFKILFWLVIAAVIVCAVAAAYQFIFIPHLQSSLLEKNNQIANDKNLNIEKKSDEKKPNGNLFVTIPETLYATTSEGQFVIHGVNSDSASGIRVVFSNDAAGLHSDYYLSDFNQGDHNWQYAADTKYENMAPGKNVYEISLYNGQNVLDEDTVVIDLINYPKEKMSITVAWLDKLKLITKLDKNTYGEDVNIDNGQYPVNGVLYEAGIITSGEYNGQKIYSFSPAEPGFSLIRLLKIKDEYWNLETLNLSIVGLNEMPNEINFPGGNYTLKKADWLSGFENSFTEDRIIFKDKAAGSLYLTCWPEAGKKTCDRSSCIMAKLPDHTYIAYDFNLPFLTEDKPIDIIFSDGSKNKDIYRFIQPTCSAICRSYNFVGTGDLIVKDNLKIAGIAGKETFYEPKDKNSADYQSLYNDKFTIAYRGEDGMSTTSKYTYEEFLKMHPVLFWKDPAGRWIRFTSSNFDTMAEMCKPVVYLYPKKDTNISVQVAPNGGLTFSNPLYQDGWNVLARPDGKLSTRDNKNYDYLFWEGVGINLPWPNEGFVVKKNELKSFFHDSLAELSLNKKEIKDFEDYWLQRLQGSEYWQISFIDEKSFDKVAPLKVDPMPDTIIRAMMYAKPLLAPIKIEKQILQGKVRTGFTVVEWGGAAFDQP
jgi:hypothetical protein